MAIACVATVGLLYIVIAVDSVVCLFIFFLFICLEILKPTFKCSFGEMCKMYQGCIARES